MGIAFVLIFYLVASSVAAAIGGLVLSAGARWYLHGVPRANVTALKVGTFPFACVLFAGLWFAAYALINDRVFHQDPSLGDGWYADIGDGYAIDMIDVTDYGVVHPTDGPSNGLNHPDGVWGVTQLQIAGTELLGSQDNEVYNRHATQEPKGFTYFSVNTRDHHKTTYANQNELADHAREEGFTLDLKPILTVYQQERSSKFDLVAVGILLSAPTLAFGWLLRRLRVMKMSHFATCESNLDSRPFS